MLSGGVTTVSVVDYYHLPDRWIGYLCVEETEEQIHTDGNKKLPVGVHLLPLNRVVYCNSRYIIQRILLSFRKVICLPLRCLLPLYFPCWPSVILKRTTVA